MSQRKTISDPTVYDTSAFKKLKAEWDKKLDKSGFVDIERAPKSIAWPSFYFPQVYTTERFQDLAEYYRLASMFFHENPWHDKWDKIIWELHTTGLYNKEIAQKIGKSEPTVQRSVLRSSKVFKEWYR